MSYANTQDFKAGFILGGNASQINGDLHAGFDKLGWHAGLKVIRDMTEKTSWTTELLYSQRGSKAGRESLDPFEISLEYVEIPLLFSVKDWYKDDFYRMRFEAGASIARLLNDKVEDAGGTYKVEGVNATDISAIVGVTYFSTEHLGFSARYTHSINLLRSEKKNPNLSRYRGYFLTFRFLYLL